MVAGATAAVLAISAQSASASVPTIGQLAAAAPSGTGLSVCDLAPKVPVCQGIPGSVISTMRSVPANSDGAARAARSVGLADGSATFAYCHGSHVTGISDLEKECVFVSEFV